MENDLLAEAINTSQAEFNVSQTTPTIPVVETPAVTAHVETPITTPTVTTPVVEPTVTTPATFNEVEYLKTNFGVDKLEDAKTRFSGISQLEEQNKNYVSEIEKLKLNPTFKGGDISKFVDEALAKGVPLETIAQLAKIKDVDSLSAEDKWKYNEKVNHPYKTDAEINAQFNHKFGVDDLEDDNVKLLKSAALKEESVAAGNGIKDYINKTLAPAQSPEVAQAEAKVKLDALAQSWQPNIGKVSSGLKEVSKQIPIQTFGAKDGEVTQFDFKYAVPEADQKAIEQDALKAALRGGVQADDNGIKQVADYAKELLWARHGEKIALAYVQDAVTHLTKNFAGLVNNPELARTLHANSKQTDLNQHEQSVVSAMSANR